MIIASPPAYPIHERMLKHMNNYMPGRPQFSQGNTVSATNAYEELLKLKAAQAQQPQPYRTVFNDIADEWSSCSEEERNFIEQDPSYVKANIDYSQQFNSFLLDQFGLQFINSKYGTSAEKVLIALKDARNKFRKSTIEDVNKIKNENLALQKQVKELEELINGNAERRNRSNANTNKQ